MITVLYAHKRGPYYGRSDLDVWDISRDAKGYIGSEVVIAHPPCRLWGRFRKLSTAPIEEKDLARSAVKIVQSNGGVLEHPQGSLLWKDQRLPLWPFKDCYGGYTLTVDQYWWGHRARKRTWLYIVGLSPRELPRLPLVLGEAAYTVSTSRGTTHKREIGKIERQLTPPAFALWLVDVARRIEQKKLQNSVDWNFLIT